MLVSSHTKSLTTRLNVHPGHATVISGDSLFLFGGFYEEFPEHGEYKRIDFNDLYILNMVRVYLLFDYKSCVQSDTTVDIKRKYCASFRSAWSGSVCTMAPIEGPCTHAAPTTRPTHCPSRGTSTPSPRSRTPRNLAHMTSWSSNILGLY